MKSELKAYRSEKFRDGMDKYEWLLGNLNFFPTVSRLFRYFMGIPATQIEN